MSASSELFGGGGGTPKKWVSGTNYTEGTVVWSPSDYQYYMRKTTGAGATDPASDSANWQPTGDRAIKSFQHGIGTPTLTAVAISAVNVNKTEVRITGYGKDSSGVVQAVLYGYLSNSTTLTLNGSPSYSGGGGFYYEIIERY